MNRFVRIAAAVIVVFLIWKYWQPIAAFVSGFVAGMSG